MKATIEFNLPEEEREHMRMLKALDLVLAINKMDNYLRSKVKYEELNEEAHNAFASAREELYSILNEYNINLDEL